MAGNGCSVKRYNYSLTLDSFSIKLPFMFIRRVAHKDRKNRKEYYTYKLIESIRAEGGPRQRDVLNLGVHFNLPKEQWFDA